jgi:hypothetical protein
MACPSEVPSETARRSAPQAAHRSPWALARQQCRIIGARSIARHGIEWPDHQATSRSSMRLTAASKSVDEVRVPIVACRRPQFEGCMPRTGGGHPIHSPGLTTHTVVAPREST